MGEIPEACAKAQKSGQPKPAIRIIDAMQIDQYSFGHIEIARQSYDSDVIIFPDHLQGHWRRRKGHELRREDIETVLAGKPEVLVVGTGYYGRMQVSEQTLNLLRAAGIDVRIAKTANAVDEFNRLQRERANIVAALHLTC